MVNPPPRRQRNPEIAMSQTREEWEAVGMVIMTANWRGGARTPVNSIAVTNSPILAQHIVNIHNAKLTEEKQ